MPRIVFENMARYGIVKDRLAHTLPLEAWSDGENVRFFEEAVQRISGHQTLWTPQVDPWWMMPVLNSVGDLYWMYANGTAVWALDDTNTHADITRAVGGPYGALFTYGWNGGVLNTIPVINNGVDVPQMWTPVGLAQQLQDLTAWPGTYRAAVVRPLGNFLVALDITKSGTRYPLNVLWSHPAVPGAVPASWDVTDPTKDAGENALAETGGAVLDMVPMRNVGIIYKEDATYMMQYVGGASIFRFPRITAFNGVYSRHCVVPFNMRGDKHFVITQDDIIVHDGQTSESVADERMRRWIFEQIDTTFYQRLQAVANPQKNEIWVLIPTDGDGGYLTTAAIWSYKNNRWSIRKLPNAYFGASGQVRTDVAMTWDAAVGTWDEHTESWDTRAYAPNRSSLILGVPGANKSLSLCDSSNYFGLATYTAFVERVGLAVISQDREGNPKFDLQTRKLVTELWPRIEGTEGATVTISVGRQENVNGVVTWEDFPFVIGTDVKINPLIEGLLLAVRFTSTGNHTWKLYGFDMVIEPLGAY